MATELLEGRNAEKIASALETIAISHAGGVDITNFRQVQDIVRSGRIKNYFNVGDQLVTTWSPDGIIEYEMPWDIIGIKPVYGNDGKLYKNAIWIQSHYALPELRYDSAEAFYVTKDALPAGEYHFSMSYTPGTLRPGDLIVFTLTKAVPANGMLVLGAVDGNDSVFGKDFSTWRVYTYANGLQATPTETVTVAVGTGGTDLGMLDPATVYSEYGMNSIRRVASGYNRWSQTVMRQWLNSDAEADKWWMPANPFDYRPPELSTMRGFIAGLSEDFASVIQPIKVTTHLHAVIDAEIGDTEDTYDKFFCPSLEEEYIESNQTGEGVPAEYWIKRLSNKQAQQTPNAAHIRYSIVDNTRPMMIRTRTIFGDNTWYITTAGAAKYGGIPTTAYGIAPICAIY